MSNTLRITGMASGLDVDSMVKTLMQPDNMKIDKMKQDRQLIQWRQDAYRDVLSDLTTLKSSYFDVTKPDNFMLTANAYSGFDVTATSNIPPGVTATAVAGAAAGTYSVNVVDIAKPAIKGPVATVNSPGAVTSTTKLTDLGAGSAVLSLNLAYNSGAPVNISIDNSDGSKTIADVINAVNTATAGNVSAKYSELTKQFTLQTALTGNSASIEITGGSADLLTALGQSVAVGTAGQNANITITPPGGAPVAVTDKATNNFTIDGIKYNLSNAAPGSTTTITVSTNTQKTFDKIKGFIDKYNDLIGKISAKLEEKVPKGYPPLTDDQKKAMSADDIKAWETKAKEGLLRNDSSLQNMLSSMRRAFFDSVQGAGVSLNEIGLNTSSDISQRGKIVIDEDKLKSAIENKGTQLQDIFMKASSVDYVTGGDNSTRYGQEGIFQRINDTLKEYTTTIRGVNGKKGILVEKAGIKGDFTEFNNLLSQQLQDKDKLINDMLSKLSEKEDNYYNKFSKLESAMQQANSQSSWIAKQMG